MEPAEELALLQAQLRRLRDSLTQKRAALAALADPPAPAAERSGARAAAAALRQLQEGLEKGSRCVVCSTENYRHEAWATTILPRGYLALMPIELRPRVDLALQVCSSCRRLFAQECDAERRRLDGRFSPGDTHEGTAPGQGPRVSVRGAAELLRFWEVTPPDVLEIAERKHEADAARLQGGAEQYERYKELRKELARRLLQEPGGIGKPGGILTKSMGLSAATRAELRKAVAAHVGKPQSELTADDLAAVEADPAADNLEIGGHAADVVSAVLAQPDGLAQFARRWRQVFVTSTRPPDLPEGWDPEPLTSAELPPPKQRPAPANDWMDWWQPKGGGTAPGLRRLALSTDDGAAPVVDVAADLARLSPDDAERALLRAKEAGVTGVVSLSTAPADCEAGARLDGVVPGVEVWSTAGLHPLRAAEWSEDCMLQLRKSLTLPRVVALGECGLDYTCTEPPRDVQMRCFEDQLAIAVELGLPLLLHERDADPPRGCQADLLACLRRHRVDPSSCIVHCFTGDQKALQEYVDWGCTVGVAGLVARLGPRSVPLRTALASGVLPLDRLVVETDAPHLRPDAAYVPLDCDLLPRGRSEPALTPAVVRGVAECFGVPPAEVALAASRNAARVLRLGSAVSQSGAKRLSAAPQSADAPEKMLARRLALCEPFLTARGCRRGDQCTRRHAHGWQQQREWLRAAKCRFGSGCSGRQAGDDACALSHIGQPVFHICMMAVAGRCRRGDACWYAHPPEDACKVLAPLFSVEPCHYGDRCRREVCIRGHGPELTQQEVALASAKAAAAAAAAAEDGEAEVQELCVAPEVAAEEERLRSEVSQQVPTADTAALWGSALCSSVLLRLDDASSYARRAAAVEELQQIIRRVAYPRCRLLLFGSTVTGLAEQGADADVALVVSPAEDTVLSDAGAVDGLFGTLSRLPFAGLRRVSRARVPIVSNAPRGNGDDLPEGALGQRFDLTFRTVGVRNSLLLRQYLLAAGPAARLAAAGARAWAKGCGIVNPRRALTSYAVLVLFIHFLIATRRVRFVAPSAVTLGDAGEAVPSQVPLPEPDDRLRAEAGALLGEFWRYYADFDWATTAVTLLRDPDSAPLPLRRTDEDTQTAGRARPYRVFVIEDPYEDDGEGRALNLGRKMAPLRAATTRIAFLRAACDYASPPSVDLTPIFAPPAATADGDDAPGEEDSGQLKLEVARLLARSDDVLDRLARVAERFAPRRLDGLQRLTRKVETEKAFLVAMHEGGAEATMSRVRSSNLATMDGVSRVVAAEKDVVAVGRTFPGRGPESAPVEVDVVAAGGRRWVKVRGIDATNALMVADGTARWGGKPCSMLAREMAAAAAAHPLAFGDVPECVVAYVSDVSQDILDGVEKAGVRAVRLSQVSASGDGLQLTPPPPDGRLVSLDVTGLCAVCSDLTNGGTDVEFTGHPVLEDQRRDELSTHAGEELREWLEDKELLVCERAKADFEEILSTVGGDGERARYAALRERVRFVPDAPSPRVEQLPRSRRIKNRQCTIFGTADAHRAVTVTANDKFVSAAAEQGVVVAARVIPARALTEQKRCLTEHGRVAPRAQ